MTHDYPTVSYQVVQLPGRPGGKGTLQYDGGWGLAAASKNKTDAMAAISYLTTARVQLGNAKAFGVMPSVKAASARWKQLYPKFAAFLAGADYSKSIPTVPDNRDRARRLQPATPRASAVPCQADPGQGQRRAAGDPVVKKVPTDSTGEVRRRRLPPAGDGPTSSGPGKGGERWRRASREAVGGVGGSPGSAVIRRRRAGCSSRRWSSSSACSSSCRSPWRPG